MPAVIREVRFVSSNEHKIAEARAILSPRGVTVVPVSLKIEELQTTDTRQLVHDKLLKAYKQVGRPLFVEHTGLYISKVKGLPGGLTQIVWDALQADDFAGLFGSDSGSSPAEARTWISYCDGRQIVDCEGKVGGMIVSPPRGSRTFQWDCVFQPDGSEQTFAEMGARKNRISMRRAALDKLAAYVTGVTADA
jgi:XTP/dITP diphosphohydrolase